MKAPLSKIPVLPAAVGIIVGIAAAQIGLAFACFAICIAAFIILYFYNKHYLSFFFVMALAGAALAYAHTPRQLSADLTGHPLTVSGQIKSVAPRASTEKYVVLVDSIDGKPTRRFKCVFYSSGYHREAEPGALVSFKATLNPVAGKDDVPYAIDYAKYLKYDGISATAFLDGNVNVTHRAQGFDRIVVSIRNAMYNGIVDSPIDGPTAAFLLAVILGDDSFITNDTEETFRTTGLSHMLALSGLHVGLIAAMIGFVLFPANISRRGLRLKPLVIILLVWVYAVITGSGPSVTRATAMITAFLAARMLQRDANPYNSLCLAIVVVLIINPNSLFTPGFQMSFAAVLSILLFAPLLPDTLRRKPVLWFVLNLSTISVAAMLGAGIVAAYYFHAFPLSFLIANIAAGLLFPFLLGAGLVLMLLTMCGWQAAWIGWVVDALFWLLDHASAIVRDYGPAPMRNLFFSAWAFLPYALFLLLLAYALRRTINRDDMQPFSHATSWVLCAGAFAAFVAFAVFLKPAVPAAELYITSGAQPGIILRHGSTAYAMPFAKYVNTANFLDSYNHRYEGFLHSRGCSGFEVMPQSFENGPFYRNGDVLIASDKFFYLATHDEAAAIQGKAHFALVSAGYTKSARELIESAPADTILICPGTHGQRANRLLRECEGIVPCRKCSSLSLHWW